MPATHVRLRIYPDGGVSRLRLLGVPRLPEAVARLNAAPRDGALTMLASLCGSRQFFFEGGRRETLRERA